MLLSIITGLVLGGLLARLCRNRRSRQPPRMTKADIDRTIDRTETRAACKWWRK